MDGTPGNRELSDVDEKCLVSIKVKTLDSRTYTILVPKDIPVPLLKERIALDANVPPELQRLICRGKVLKDDQRLSEYNVEDDHVLHLVARLAAPATNQGQASDTPPRINAADTQGSMPSLTAMPGVTMRALSMPVDATGLPDLNRIIASVLNTFDSAVGGGGAGGGERDGAEAAGSRETNNGNGGVRMQSNTQAVELRIDTVYGLPPGLHVLHGPPFGLLGVGGPSSNQVDSLVIMRQYLERFQAALQHSAEVARRENGASESARVDEAGYNTLTAVASDLSQSPAPSLEAGSAPSVGPNVTGSSRRADTPVGEVRPAELVPLLQLVESLLRGRFSEHLAATSRELLREQSTLDANERSAHQRVIHQGGNHLQQLGSLLQELGRACLSVRLGSNPTAFCEDATTDKTSFEAWITQGTLAPMGESHLRLGPAVFINQFGPNPMIVQPRRNSGAHQGAVQVLASNGETQPHVSVGGLDHTSTTPTPSSQSGGASTSVVLPVPPASGEAEPSGSGRTAPLSVDHSQSAGVIHVGSQSFPFGQSLGIEQPRESIRQPGTVDESGNRRASGTFRNSGPFGPSVFGPSIAQIEVQIGSTPMQVSAQPEQSGQGPPTTTPTVVTFRPPLFRPGQDLPMREQSMEENASGVQLGNGSNREQGTAASSPAPGGTAQPGSGNGREAAGGSAPNQNREEGGASLQGDLAQLLSPLIRQLAGALQRVQDIPPPPPPQQAPPAAPPAPVQQPVAPRLEEEPSNMPSPPITTEATQPIAPARAEGQENTAGVDSGVSPGFTPLGLGLGGLRPLPRSRRRAPQPPSVEQQLLREGARALSLGLSSNEMPGSSMSQHNTSSERTATRQQLGGPFNTSSGIDQLLGPMMGMQTPQSGPRQAADNPLGNMMQLLGRENRGNSEATGQDPLGGMLQALSGEGGSPGGLGSFMNQMMRSPAMNSMARQLAGPPGLGNMMTAIGDGGVDLGGMMAQMMPMVSQVLSGMRENQAGPGGTQSRGANTQSVTENEEWKRSLTVEEVEMMNAQLAEDEKRQASMEPQRPLSDAYLRSSPFKRRRMAMEKTAQKLQEGADPQEVLKSVTEVAMEGAEGGEMGSSKADWERSDLPQHISTAPGLAEAYVGVLWHDLANRTATDSDVSGSGNFEGVRTMLSPQNLESDGAS